MIFNISIWIIYPVVFDKYIYENQIIIKINTHIKFIKIKQKEKKHLYRAPHFKNIVKE
jgi:hypothetical protein